MRYVVIDEYPLSLPPTVHGPFEDEQSAETFRLSLEDENGLTQVVPLTEPVLVASEEELREGIARRMESR